MKIIDRFFKNNKNIRKVKILVGCAIILFLITLLLWEFWLSKYYIFEQNEEAFKEAVEKYYEYRPNLLPKKEEIRTVTLGKLFTEDRVESLKIPKTETLCDTNSWVKVYQDENGKYIYYIYLKCGKFESKVDHTGPVIELNGEKEIITNYGQEYNDPGVKSVTDDSDGKIDPTKVEIDTSRLNTNKVGSYRVTYKVSDSLNNQTKVTRTVIVAKNLTETIKAATDDSNYYKGQIENNYLQFSGMLWRIINVNEDGTIKIISADVVSNLRYNGDKYQDSNIDKWLTKVFLPSIESSNYLVESNYCVGAVSSIDDYSNACSEIYKGKVGILTADEYSKTVANDYSSITAGSKIYLSLANKVNGQAFGIDIYNAKRYFSNNMLAPIKPVITIKNNIYITSGDGTKDKPYKLQDYAYAKEHDKLNTRIIGEYFNYSGLNFRIIGKEKNNIQAIMVEPLWNNTTNKPLTVDITNINNYKFNIKDENNPGYIMNNEFIDYINESALIKNKYQLLTHDNTKTYDQFSKEEINAKLMLISTTDLFSGLNPNFTNNTKSVQLYADVSSNENLIYMLNVMDGVAFEIENFYYASFALRAKALVNGSLEIKSGKGTYTEPYILK